MTFKIDKGIPLPPDAHFGDGVAATLRKMVVGDSVLDPETDEEKVKPRWYSAASRQKRTITIRKVIDPKTKKCIGHRVWLTQVESPKT